jgi:PKD repeat protein
VKELKLQPILLLCVFLMVLLSPALASAEEEDQLNIISRIYTDYQYDARVDDLNNTTQALSDINPADLIEISEEVLASESYANLTVVSDNRSITISDGSQFKYLYDVAINYSDIEPLVRDGNVTIVHYDENGEIDTQWTQAVANVSGYAVFEAIPFTAVTIYPRVNPLINAGFEAWTSYSQGKNPDSWVNGTADEIHGMNRSTDAINGTYSFSITGNTAYSMNGHITQEYTPNAQVKLNTFGCWIKNVNATSGFVVLNGYNGVTDFYKNIYMSGNYSNWTYVNFTVTTGSAWYGALSIYEEGINTGGTVLIDAVTLTNSTAKTATETSDTTHFFQNYTYTANDVYSPLTVESQYMSTNFTTWTNITSVTAKVDGTTKSAWRAGDRLYVDVSGLTAAAHAVNITVTYTASGVAPVASFTKNNTGGNVPFGTAFTDSSTNTPTSWAWNFGDGSSNVTTQSPTHQYTTAGTYTVILTAVNAAGSHSSSQTITALPAKPVAGFTGNTTSGNYPLSVAFTDSSTNTPTSWAWSWGDATANGTTQNPTHTYTTAGTYTVTLTATNAGGSGGYTRTNYITVGTPPPVTGFSANVTTGIVPKVILFTDSSTNTPTSWSWNFGDGTSNATTQNPTHTYSSAGTYTVTLTSSNAGGSNSYARTSYIVISPQVDALFTSNTTDGYRPHSVQFTDQSTGSPTAWAWNFGDGTANSTSQNPIHTYTTSGTYTVTLTASKPGSSDTESKIGYCLIETTPPVASFTQNATSGTFPKTIQFTDTSTGTKTGWNWDFGDGGSSTAQNPTHTYTTAGTYTVALLVTNDDVYDDYTAVDLITITTPIPVASFSANVTTGNAPYNVLFTDSSTNTPTSWSWNFGDGTANSTSQNPVHSYTVSGTYTVILTSVNAGGSHSYARTNYITVLPAKPVASFSANTTIGNKPFTVLFTDSSTNTPTSWAWDFGDGSANSTSQNPTHTYTNNGTYTVTLTSTNAGGSGGYVRTNYIVSTLHAPVADFTQNITTGTFPKTIQFTDSSTYSSTYNTTYFNWNFGDGTGNSTSQNPVHTYTAAGTYTVVMTASNAGGSSTSQKTNLIIITTPIPVTDFSGNVTSGNVPFSVAFTDSSTNTPTSWAYNFGDGTANSTTQNPVHTYTTAGTYTVTLVSTNAGGSGSKVRTSYITALPAKPVESFTINVTSGDYPLHVLCTDTSTNTPTAWNWYSSLSGWTNGTSSTKVYTFMFPGTHTITAQCSNAGGSSGYVTKTITVTTPIPVVSFVSNKTDISANTYVAFTGTGTNTPTSWSWSFGDGSANSTLQNPTHKYTSEGTYTVTLVATNAGGSGSYVRTNYITVTPEVPVASFSANITNGSNPLTVQFTDTTNNATTWYWDFGDGEHSHLRYTTHTFYDAGEINVSLRVNNSAGISYANTIITVGAYERKSNYTRHVKEVFVKDESAMQFSMNIVNMYGYYIPIEIIMGLIMLVPFVLLYSRQYGTHMCLILYLFIGGVYADAMTPLLGKVIIACVVLATTGTLYKMFNGD